MLDRFLFIVFFVYSAFAVDFLFDSFTSNDLIFTGDARVNSSVVTLTSAGNKFSIGRAFYPHPTPQVGTNNTFSSFSTSFVFSIRPESRTSPGFGLAFVVSNSTIPEGTLSGQYFGLFNDSVVHEAAPLLVVEFYTGQNPEFNQPDGNHIGINLNSVKSIVTHEAGFFNSTTLDFIPINMRSGINIQAWIDFDGSRSGINITIAPAGVSRPSKPLISFYNPIIRNYTSTNMFFGFSASKTTWVEAHTILAWSLSDEGVARDIYPSSLGPDSFPRSLPSPQPFGLIIGVVSSVVVMTVLFSGISWFWLKKGRQSEDEEEKIQEWELEYWPHRFSYEELAQATKGFSKDELLGSGGFGKVYKGTLAHNIEIAVKCVNQDSNQGLREFMAEISSIGRLQHRNLVHMRGWCKKGRELMLVYDYMPNGNFYEWIFSKSRLPMGWQGRLQVLMDVAEGLSYLHHGWDHLVLHRDIKTSNILLDSGMRGRLGDFGLAKLYKHGQAPTTTRLVGTIGYMAPELLKTSPTAASDTYSFGVVVCGRRPTSKLSIDEPPITEWVKNLLEEGRLHEVTDQRIAGEYNVEDIEMVLKLGLECCNLDPQLRPTMREVVAALSGVVISAFPDRLLPEHQSGNSPTDGDTSTTSKFSFITEPGPRT